MVFILALKWWYGRGWLWAWDRSVNIRIKEYAEAFSMKQLIKTWFSPFKQTYNNAQNGSIDLKVQAFFDNIVSRFIGTLARTVLIFVGLLAILVAFISGIVIIIVWPFVPLLPLAGIVLALSGVGV